MKKLYLRGDLHQMSVQVIALAKIGMKIFQVDMTPQIEPEDIPKALRYLMKEEVEGWWNYEEELIEHGICDKGQFDRALHWYIESRR